MEAKIKIVDEFKAVGISYFGNNENGEIIKLWAAFNSRYMEIKNKSQYGITYGICDDMPDSECRFHYVAAAEVDNLESIPEGMKTIVVPKGKYAVYTFKDTLDKLGKFYEDLFTKVMPEAGYELDMRPQFELYDERYMKNGEFDLYMPIK